MTMSGHLTQPHPVQHHRSASLSAQTFSRAAASTEFFHRSIEMRWVGICVQLKRWVVFFRRRRPYSGVQWVWVGGAPRLPLRLGPAVRRSGGRPRAETRPVLRQQGSRPAVRDVTQQHGHAVQVGRLRTTKGLSRNTHDRSVWFSYVVFHLNLRCLDRSIFLQSFFCNWC